MKTMAILNKKILFLSLALTLSLVGCATTEGYEQLLDTWYGSSEDNLIASWGVPRAVYETDGKKYMVFFEMSESYVSPNPFAPFGYMQKFHCETTFTFENGRVTGWRYKGNKCKA